MYERIAPPPPCELKERLLEELTCQEQRILRLVYMGHTNKAIATALFCSIHTIATHRKNILRKCRQILGVANCTSPVLIRLVAENLGKF